VRNSCICQALRLLLPVLIRVVRPVTCRFLLNTFNRVFRCTQCGCGVIALWWPWSTRYWDPCSALSSCVGNHVVVFILPLARLDKVACHTSSSIQVTNCRCEATCTARPQVLVYNFADLRLLHSIETLSNPTGIIALSAAAEQTTLACPGLHAGQVQRRGTDAPQACESQARRSQLHGVDLNSEPQTKS
jgi:hypothetical protein